MASKLLRVRQLSTTTAIRQDFTQLQTWAAKAKEYKLVESDRADTRRIRQWNATLPKWARVNLATAKLDLTAFHLTLFQPEFALEELAEDGTEKGMDDPLTPTLDGRRLERMWASGRFDFETANPIVADQDLTQSTNLDRYEVKTGQLGLPTIFVWVKRVVSNKQGPCLTESRCRIYRHTGASSSAAKSKSPKVAASLPSFDFQYEWKPDTPALFRFSALTFNSHKIHYDQQYCRDVEGRPDLVVHGPLNATILARLASTQAKSRELTVESFEYRATKPAYVDRPLQYGGKWTDKQVLDMSAMDEEGDTVMSAKAIVR